MVEILDFIDISIGALATMIPTSAPVNHTHNVTIISTLAVPQIAVRRPFLVLYPSLLVTVSYMVIKFGRTILGLRVPDTSESYIHWPNFAGKES